MMFRKSFIWILLFISIQNSLTAFEIKGEIILPEGWHKVVFLASLDSPEDLFVASPEFIISKSIIDQEGKFILNNVTLPDDPRFYRLYLVKNELSSVEFNTSENKNFIHFILDNDSKISLKAKVENNRLELIDFDGSELNRGLLNFDEQLFSHKKKFVADISKARSDFLILEMEKFIKDFIDSTENIIAGLYALSHIDEIETDFLRNSKYYFDFQDKMHTQFPEALYTKRYDDLITEMVGFRDMVCEMPVVAKKWKNYVIVIESVLLIALLVVIFLFYIRFKKLNRIIIEKNENDSISFSKLTLKERDILKLLSEGKSNKEIAGLLFIELSTVKSHISSIYKQLNVSERKNAVDYYNSLKKKNL